MPGNSWKNKELQVEEWIKKADDDESSIKGILEDHHGSPNTICFLSQQMAEKYLKAFLVFHIGQFPKIHSTDALWRLCRKIDKNLEDIKEDAVFLVAFYAATRYPGDFPNFSWQDAEKAFAAAQKIKKIVFKKLKIK